MKRRAWDLVGGALGFVIWHAACLVGWVQEKRMADLGGEE